MRTTWIVSALAVAIVVTAACGKSEEQKQAEAAAAQAQAAAAQAQKATADATTQAQQGMKEMAKGLEAMAQGMQQGGAKPVDPVSFRDLQALFPDLEGWTKGTPKGERMTAPVGFSQAEVSYQKDASQIELKIVDSGFNQMLLAPYMMFLGAGYEKETDSGYEKATTIGGEPGWEKWDSESKRGEMNAIVGNRFLVQTTGNDIADTKVLRDVMAKTNFTKLAGMK